MKEYSFLEYSWGLILAKILTKQANTEIPCTHMTPEREEYVMKDTVVGQERVTLHPAAHDTEWICKVH